MRKLFLFTAILLASCFSAYADNMSTFFDQLNVLIAKAETDHFSSIKGILTSTDENGVKSYTSKLPLTYFKLIITEKGEGRFITAISINEKEAGSFIGGLLDAGFRSLNGIALDKQSDYKAANPSACTKYSSATLLKKTGSSVNVLVMKSNTDASYSIMIL